MRAGVFGLSLLADPLTVSVLRALEEGSLELPALRQATGSPPPTTLRTRLRELSRLGILERRQATGFGKSVSHDLTQAGRDLLLVGDDLESWLGAAPDGGLRLGSSAAKHAIMALTEGWSTAILRALAARPLSLTELDRVLRGANYPALERRLAAMRLVGQVAPQPQGGSPVRYTLTRWTREAAGPILSVAAWEDGLRIEGAERLGKVEVEAIFMLAVTLVEAPATVRGTCGVTMYLSGHQAAEKAGVVVCLDSGLAVACRSDRRAAAPNRARGSLAAWLDAILYGHGGQVERDGDPAIVETILTGLHRASAARSTPSRA